jgi:multimeric flavodoxin WrbA
MGEVTRVNVVAFNGSARRTGNTSLLIETAFEPLRAAGVECTRIDLGGETIRGCIACMKCAKAGDGNCHGIDDLVSREAIPAAQAADAIIIGSPTYFADVSAETKALIDRLGYASRQGGPGLRRKLGAAVVAVRRGGAIHAFDTINHLFLISEMVVVGSSYWNVGIGRRPGEVADDDEGMGTMRTLGENLAWALPKLRG